MRAGLSAKAAQGHAIGRAPLGYRHEKPPSGRGAWTVPHARTMPILLQLLRGYASGAYSFRTLAQELNARGFRTADGRPFTESSISTVLNNRFYDGKAVYHRARPDEEIRDGVHQVPEEVRALWRKCQEVRHERVEPGQPSPPSKEQRIYPLTGVLICDGCGQPFHGITCRSHNNVYRRMSHCWHRCSMRPFSVDAARVEEEFSERVLACLDLDDGWRKTVLQALTSEGPEPDHSLDIKRAEAALANLRKQHLWGVIGDEQFKGEYQALQRQIRALEPSPSPVLTPNLDRAAQLLRNLPALWHHAGVTPRQRRDLTREDFQEVRLRQGKLVAVEPRPQYVPLFAYGLWHRNVAGGERSS